MEEVQNFSIRGCHPKRRQALSSPTYWSKRDMRALDQETDDRAGVGGDGAGPRYAKLRGGRSMGTPTYWSKQEMRPLDHKRERNKTEIL